MSAGRSLRGAPPRRGRGRPAVTLALAALLGGCDLGGPSGPTEVLGTVTGDAQLGAAVVELTWEGITSIEGRGTTLVYWAPVNGLPNRHRAVLVDAEGGELRFTVGLGEERMHAPAITIVSAADTGDLPLQVGGLRVVLER